jgi:hypothetical protein
MFQKPQQSPQATCFTKALEATTTNVIQLPAISIVDDVLSAASCLTMSLFQDCWGDLYKELVNCVSDA